MAVGAAVDQAYTANANKQAAGHTANVNAQTIADTKTENNALFAPTIARGDQAGSAINNFLGLNGSQPQSDAFDAYKGSTGYQFQLNSGSDAIASNRAASGLLKSGSTLKALNKYGQDVASTYTQNYLSDLGGQQSAGLGAAGNNAASNSSAAGMSVGNQNNLLANQTQARNDSSNALTNLVGNLVSAYSYGKGQSSYGTK